MSGKMLIHVVFFVLSTVYLHHLKFIYSFIHLFFLYLRFN